MAADYVWYNGKYQQVGESTVVRQLKVQVVNSLPSEGTPGILYVVPSSGPISNVSWGDISGTLGDQTDLQAALDSKANNSALSNITAAGVSYTTTEPTSPNTDGLKFVVLNYEPNTRYDGWIYIITD